MNFAVTCCALAQTRPAAFKLTDSGFVQGSVFRGCQILFDFDGKNDVRSESYPCLDSVADLMKKHPEIIWELGSHTDQRGSDTFNLKLSQARANQVVKYLVSVGVSDDNIVGVGYGESQLINNDEIIKATSLKADKEKLYQENRRTEFKVLYKYKSRFTLTDSTFEVGARMRCAVTFDINKATIRPESKPLLDSVAVFLIAHPNLFVEVSNHRDSRGNDYYSTDLSKTRARAVHDYLISKGVPATQIVDKGYGETSPLVPESYIKSLKSKDAIEQLHQLNRRTELKILSIGNPK